MPSQAHSIRLLAAALTAGPLDDPAALVDRAKPLVGDLRKARWLISLAEKLSREFGAQPRPTVGKVADRIAAHPPFIKAWIAGRGRVMPAFVEPAMAPVEGAPRSWPVPPIATLGDLAERLELHPDDLGWLTAYGSAEHYRHRWHEKRDGRVRLIEMPKALLKHAQRQVLRRFFEAIPPHEAAKGFRKGNSVRDFVEPHTGKHVLVRFDLEDFFPSITATRVLRVFLTAGYPEPVARALTRLTTHADVLPIRRSKLLAVFPVVMDGPWKRAGYDTPVVVNRTLETEEPIPWVEAAARLRQGLREMEDERDLKWARDAGGGGSGRSPAGRGVAGGRWGGWDLRIEGMDVFPSVVRRCREGVRKGLRFHDVRLLDHLSHHRLIISRSS